MKWNNTFKEMGIEGHDNINHQEFIEQYIPKDLHGLTVLDIGAWDGYYSMLCAREGAYVIAIDNGWGEYFTFIDPKVDYDEYRKNEEMQRKAFNNLFNKYRILNNFYSISICFCPLEAMEIDMFKNKFDLVLCLGVFYHIEDPFLFFKKIYNQLAEGGTVIIEGQLKGKEEGTVYFCNRNFMNDPSNFWIFTESSIQEMLKRIGFRDIKILGTQGNELSRIILEARK